MINSLITYIILFPPPYIQPNLLHDTTSKLSDSQSRITNLTLQRDAIGKRLDVFRYQLEEKQQEFQSYVRKTEKSKEGTKKPEEKKTLTKKDSTVAAKGAKKSSIKKK